MSDAVLCDGCGRYFPADRRFVVIEMWPEAIRYGDFIIDDLPTSAFRVIPGATDDGMRGDLCDECGREVLEMLAELSDREET